MNNFLLREIIEQSGLKKTFIAEKMGLSRYGLQLKLDGVHEFKRNEIVDISNILHLDAEDRNNIFFNE